MELTGETVEWSHAQYNSDRTRVRSTNLKWFSTSQGPRAYYWNVLNPQVEEKLSVAETPVRALQMGNIVHECLLEGKKNYKIMKSRRNSNATKDLMEEFPDHYLITKDQEAQVQGMVAGAWRNPKFRRIMESGHRETEQTILFTGPHGILSKVRLDILLLGAADEGIFDIKTFMGASRDKFNSEIRRLRYEFSGAMYRYALRQVKGYEDWDAPFFHVVLCKEWPYYCYVWELDKETYLTFGEDALARAYEQLGIIQAACKEGGFDPASEEALPFWPDMVERHQDTPNVCDKWNAPSGYGPDSAMSEPEDGAYA